MSFAIDSAASYPPPRSAMLIQSASFMVIS
jgi:hypothetical protein